MEKTMFYNDDPIDLKGKSFSQILIIADRMYLPSFRWLRDVKTLQELAEKLETDALSIARWETDEEGHFRVPATVTCGRLLEFSHHVRARQVD